MDRIKAIKNCAPDEFGNLWNYGVSESFNSVHPIGKPIIHSSKLAQRVLPIGVPRSGLLDPPHSSNRPQTWFCPWLLVPLGVGNNPYPVPVMRRANECRWYAIPFTIEPARGQRCENVSHPPSKQRCDVFQDDDLRSNFANESEKLEEKAGLLAAEARASAGERYVLARETPNDDIDPYSIGSKSLCGEFSNVFINRNLWPVFAQYLLRERLNFAERDGFKSARPLKAKGEAADACEKIKDAQLFHLPHTVVIAGVHDAKPQEAAKVALRKRACVCLQRVSQRHAARPQGSTCSSVFICCSVSPSMRGCRQPVTRKI